MLKKLKTHRGKFQALLLLCVFYSFFAVTGCATYYQRNQSFHQYFQRGELENAKSELEKNRRAKRDRYALLYHLNFGMLHHLMGNYAESAEFFTKADHYAEDFQREWSSELLATISNPTVKPYPGEDYEIVMIHYYNALNFLRMNRTEPALIETRRMNIKLQELQDRYKRENVYKRDAFGHLLMGLIYDAAGEFNDAFIAYRNAYEIYTSDYKENFGTNPPQQLKKDLLRASFRSGFREEYTKYKETFKLDYERPEANEGEVIIFWDNGMGPVKDEWSINFTIIRGQAGFVTFVNEEHGISFPFFIGNEERESKLTDLRLIRVAFPKLVERPTPFRNATVQFGNQPRVSFELAQDVNAIAFKNLNDRFLREMGNALLRLAIKQLTERAAREAHEGLGLAVSIINAITEKADTRNWQTLPHNVQYVRLRLPAGKHQLNFRTEGHGRSVQKQIETEVRAGRTNFHTIRTFNSLPKK